ncbi:MAG TPA: ATP-binding protein [Terriglobia bacterium]|nr:ATP-binding protein [Terriglobia bacterium]
MSGHAITLEDLVTRFQSASESLERSYRELQGRVQSLTAELEREREERIRLERLAAMGEMAMELAHEIRNPLGSIELYASMLDGEYAGQIVRSVRLLNHSVTNVLQFGRPIVPAPERMSVSRLLEGIRVFIQPIAQQKQIRIVTDCDTECFVEADHELLHRMLLNLVLNAIRETPRDGIVCLSGQVAGSDVLIAVEDTGPGIQEERMARIFDPMFSTSREGCGLGLPIVKRIVESHNGTIAVNSSGNGTRFLITIPHSMEVVREPIACC